MHTHQINHTTSAREHAHARPLRRRSSQTRRPRYMRLIVCRYTRVSTYIVDNCFYAFSSNRRTILIITRRTTRTTRTTRGSSQTLSNPRAFTFRLFFFELNRVVCRATGALFHFVSQSYLCTIARTCT